MGFGKTSTPSGIVLGQAGFYIPCMPNIEGAIGTAGKVNKIHLWSEVAFCYHGPLLKILDSPCADIDEDQENRYRVKEGPLVCFHRDVWVTNLQQSVFSVGIVYCA